ncbi:thiamine phosphate synthase [Serpentinicella alkaliphila]|uniref:Thiamine-phosphate pyrophosphorylase n=1 Tax=Serpentinicella alkaliphila TaxID=1734049 RepID=A0A4R2TJW1_9FIRM|nr:thiamine phosphate synthase [Serpentinicella alkaliphila]QUH24655.1 thiamine phosphate synthase [Serpentinicella alkaliphila]TCQ03086.1 thiamine-phosphate pyrophosphorylase [Serpentinicella alkaliphila]
MLFVVTNRKLVETGNFLNKIEQIVAGGAGGIILREKDLPFDELLLLAKKVKAITEGSATKLIISQSIDIAIEVEAAGVQLSFEPFTNMKKQFNGLIGVSVHSVEEAVRAEDLGASYLLAGHIYTTECKKGIEPRGISFIKDIKAKTTIPLVAIGGINENNIDDVYESGAQGVALMSLIMEAEDCFKRVGKFKQLTNTKFNKIVI